MKCEGATSLPESAWPMEYRPARFGGYRGWILEQHDNDALRLCLADLFASDFAGARPVTTSSRSSSQERVTYRVRVDAHAPDPGERSCRATPLTVYVKRYRVLGPKRFVQTLLRVHKAQRAWRAARALGLKGVATPPAIAYFTRKGRFIACEQVLVTQGVEGVSLSEHVRRHARVGDAGPHKRLDMVRKRALIHSLAELVGTLHAHGIYHGDLTARNVLVEEKRSGVYRCYLVDLDSVRTTRHISSRRVIKNLDELGRNFLDLRRFSTTDRARFLRSYLLFAACRSGAFKSLFGSVLRRTKRRLRKYGQEFVKN